MNKNTAISSSQSSRNSNLKPQNKKPLRIGLIGVTGYGIAYYEGLANLVEEGRSQWAAVTIINPHDAAEQIHHFNSLGVPIYSDYRDMLAKEKQNMDWVGIPTGIGWHRQMTIDCLRVGLPVLVEKPLSPTLQDVALIQKAERETGLRVGVGFQHMYLEETWEIKKRLLDGELGEIQRIDCISLWPRPQSYFQRNDWCGKLHNGQSWILDSPLHNALSHLINLILFWSGSELGSRAKLKKVGAEIYRSKPIQTFDTIRTVAEMDNGIQAAVVLSHSSRNTYEPEILITGSRGSLLWRFCNYHTFYVGDDSYSMKTPDHIRMREIMFESITDNNNENKQKRICTTELASGAIQWVNAVHDTAPIHDISDRYRQRLVDETGEITDIIKDIDYYALRSYYEKRSFIELGVPWAVPMRERDLTNYTAFEGLFCPSPTPPIPSPYISNHGKAVAESRG